MTHILPTFTQAGLQAVFNASNTGLSCEISHIALGDAGYTPTDDATALQSEKQRVAVSGAEMIGNDQIHLTATASGNGKYWIKEIGFYLSDGTLLAVYSESDKVLTYKSAELEVLLSFDLKLSSLPANSITVDGTGALAFPPATVSKQGLVRFATKAESLARMETQAVLHPAHLAAAIPTGIILPYPAATPPEGFLECDGAAINRAIYPELYGVIGTAYGVGNDSTTFNIPDLRGEFLRGWDNGRGVDDGRVLGSFQGGTLQSADSDNTNPWPVGGLSSSVRRNWDSVPADYHEPAIMMGASGHHGWGTHTSQSNYYGWSRPRNIAIQFIIKY